MPPPGWRKPNATRPAFTAVRLGLTALILPFMIVYGPELILEGPWHSVIPAAITAICGVTLLATGLQGWFFGPLMVVQRICFFIAALMLIDSNLISDSIGAALAVLGFLLGKILNRGTKKVTVQSEKN